MIEKKFHFLAGLPRSGSTLLASIINQRSDIYATTTSPMLDLLYLNEQAWRNNPNVIANSDERQVVNISSAIINGCWEHIDKPIIIDKHRAHCRNIGVLKYMVTPNPKVIVTVRSIADILASFVRLIHISSAEGKPNFVDIDLVEMRLEVNDENRTLHLWNNYVLDPYNSFKEGWEKYRGNIHLVEYDDLTKHPVTTMRKMYSFLELEPHTHDFDNIENQTVDDDLVAWGLDGLHTIRSKLQNTSRPKDVLGADLYKRINNMGLEFWR